MSMVRLFRLLAAGAVASQGDEDIILSPVQTDANKPERLLIFIPGAGVPTENYRQTAQAIMAEASELRLTVVIPATFQRTCILQCFSPGICSLLHSSVAKAVAKANFPGTNPKEDTFVAGHSMGSVCAKNMVTGYGYEYAGLLALGGYLDKEGDTSVANYPIPVLTLGGELDGGGARPGNLAVWYEQFKNYAIQHGEEEALRRKPVHVLPGADHSSFCPGFFVTAIKDLKAEISVEEEMKSIGASVASFLHLNSPVSSDGRGGAMSVMRDMLGFTQEMCEPFLQAFEMERSGSFCETAQRVVAGLSDQDSGRLMVDVKSVSPDDFAGEKTSYYKAGSQLQTGIVSSFEESGGFGPAAEHGAAKAVDCKMLDATRIGEQLQVDTHVGTECGALTERAVAIAKQLLPQRSLDRFRSMGRPINSLKDSTVFANIGANFMSGKVDMSESKAGLEVSALALVTDISSLVFPGVHLCKLLSPAMAMEWMMTDGIKPFPYDLTGSTVLLTESIVV